MRLLEVLIYTTVGLPWVSTQEAGIPHFPTYSWSPVVRRPLICVREYVKGTISEVPKAEIVPRNQSFCLLKWTQYRSSCVMIGSLFSNPHRLFKRWGLFSIGTADIDVPHPQGTRGSRNKVKVAGRSCGVSPIICFNMDLVAKSRGRDFPQIAPQHSFASTGL
jgi:hypothetical protein